MRKLTAIILTFAVLLTACTTSIIPPEPEPPPTPNPNPIEETALEEAKKYLHENFDDMNIDGSTSMIPLHEALNEVFGSKEEVRHNRTVDAFERLVDGKNDILLSVDFSQELLDFAVESGVSLENLAITREAFVILINANNPVKSLTVGEIKRIYSGEITNWSEVGGDDAKINAFQRNRDSGSQIRMEMFMGDTPLVEKDVTYISVMGDVIEEIADFDNGKYSIAYNMYTFTEKQFSHDDVKLLGVNDVNPTDDTIFDDSYPIVIFNYIWFDKNNEKAAEFAKNLNIFLMSEEGQKLISDSGYVNLNTRHDRNKNVARPSGPDDWATWLNFYNKDKTEFYDAGNNGELLIFPTYADFFFHSYPEIKDTAKTREVLMKVQNTNLILISYGARPSWYSENALLFDFSGRAAVSGTMLFDFKYDGKYYSRFEYLINEDKYVLSTASQDDFEYAKSEFEDYVEDWSVEWLSRWDEVKSDYTPDVSVELSEADLAELYAMNNHWEDKVYIKMFG